MTFSLDLLAGAHTALSYIFALRLTNISIFLSRSLKRCHSWRNCKELRLSLLFSLPPPPSCFSGPKVWWQSLQPALLEASGLMRNPQGSWRGSEVMVRSSYDTRKGNCWQLMSVRRKVFPASRLPVARKSTLNISPPPNLAFFSFLPFWPWMPGKKCFVPSWLFASPGWPCPRPWRLQVTHRLSLAPEDTRLTVFL